jgi:tetratricopeptide (TPR) repeat protein
MARKRVNKKVALMGSMLLAMLSFAAVLVILRVTRDPAQCIADGDAARAVHDYERAQRSYSQAFRSAKSSEQKVSVLFKLADVYQAQDDWPRILASWEQIILSDPDDLRARLGKLKYSYIVADSYSSVGQNVSTDWKDILTQATELIDIAERDNLLGTDKGQWEPGFGSSEPLGWDGGVKCLGPFLYFVRGRASLELARMGAVPSPDTVFEDARKDLGKAKELDPTFVQVYRYLAAVVLETGERAGSRGNTDEQTAATKQAQEILDEGIAAVPDSAAAYVQALAQKLVQAQRGDVAVVREQLSPLEPQYVSLVEKFPSSADAAANLGEFYSLYSSYLPIQEGLEKLELALRAAQEARSLEPTRARYARFVSALYYRKFSLAHDEGAIREAIDLAESGLKLPEAQDNPGPRQYAGLLDRFALCSLLGKCYMDRILSLSQADPQREGLLSRLEETVREIRRIHGSEENPHVVKWNGMLDLAEGHTMKGVRSLYAAYEQIKASNQQEAQDEYLAYRLANIFQGTSETGAVIEFLGSALRSGILAAKPEVLLDYGDALLLVGGTEVAMTAVTSFDERFGVNDRSRQLRIRVAIARGDLDQARQQIIQANFDEPNTLRLDLLVVKHEIASLQNAGQSQALRESQQHQVELVRRLVQIDPGLVQDEDIAAVCRAMISQNDIGKARTIVDAFMKKSPTNVTGAFYRLLLSEPNPGACSDSRRMELQVQAISAVADPMKQAVGLGMVYQENGRMDEAVLQWRKVLTETSGQGDGAEPASPGDALQSPRRLAAGQLFDIACRNRDWPTAKQIIQIVGDESLDDCQGHFFAARLAIAQDKHEDALNHLNECLEQRPVFSYAYMLRGNVEAEMGNTQACVEDTFKAASLNPMDPLVAKALANALLARNNALADKVSVEQQRQTATALERAIAMNPHDMQLLDAYARAVAELDPLKALAARQQIQATSPSAANAILLGKLATRIANEESDESSRQTFLATAQSAFEQARRSDPKNVLLIESLADYYRVSGQPEKARQLLSESDNKRLLWRYYYQAGRYDKAIDELQEIVKEPNAPVETQVALESLYRRLGRNEALRRFYEAVLAQQPENIMWLTHAGAFAIAQGQYDRAVDLYEKAYRLESNASCEHQPPAETLYVAVLDGYLNALILSAGERSSSPAAWHPDRLDKVLEEGQRYNDRPYAPLVFCRMAEASKKLGDTQAVQAYCRKAVDLVWNDEPMADEVLLRVYRLIEADQTEKYCLERLAAAPDSLSANSALSSLAAVREDYDEAVVYIDKCIRLSDPDSERHVAYMLRKAHLLTLAYQKTSDKHRLDMAIEVYQSLVARMPKNSSVLNNLAYLLAQAGRNLTEALTYAKEALADEPNNAVFLDTYAFVCHKNGKDLEAVQSITAAIRQYEATGPVPAEAYEHKGMIEEALGEKADALASYRRALEPGGESLSGPTKERIQAAIERLQSSR